MELNVVYTPIEIYVHVYESIDKLPCERLVRFACDNVEEEMPLQK